MANYLTTDTDLGAVADAIRTKGGTSADLVFPGGFVDAIDAIETGGTDYLGLRAINHITSYSSDVSGTIMDYAFYKVTSLQSVSFPNIGSLKAQCFRECTGLISANFPKANGFWYSSQQFYGCTQLPGIVLPKWTSGITGEMFRGCTKLKYVDIAGVKISSAGGYGEKISANSFYGDTVFDTLILRANTVAALANINAFSGTPFASGGSGGRLYVPSAKISSYQSATNWSTIFGYGDGAQNQILPIEGSIYETQYADGTPIA